MNHMENSRGNLYDEICNFIFLNLCSAQFLVPHLSSGYFHYQFEERIAMMIQFDDNFDLKLSCSADE